jgi:hypothetical protein
MLLRKLLNDKKQELFLEGLIEPLQYQLMSHSFPSLQKLLDKAIAFEHKRVQLGDMKRKATTQGQGVAAVVLVTLSLRVPQLVQEKGNSHTSALFSRHHRPHLRHPALVHLP